MSTSQEAFCPSPWNY